MSADGPNLTEDLQAKDPSDSDPGTGAGSPPSLDYRRFFDLSMDVFAAVGFDGNLRVVNAAFERLLDRTSEELTGRPILDVVHPDDLELTVAEIAELVSGTDSSEFDNRCRCKDGSYRWIRWSVRVDVAGDVLYFVGFDVTERRVQREIVNKLVTDLESSNADLGQFAYVASHDLSEPLRMVSSYVQLLADRYRGKLDADADEFIGYAVDGAARMKALIDDLLAYSRAGRVAPVHRRVDCAALIRDVLIDLGGVVKDSGAKVTIGELPMVISDAGLLAQIFQNLLTNALKFVAPGGSPDITVSAERLGSEVQFSVRDHGIGIAPEHQERVFMMFKRLHGRTEYPGTGIGLALCQQICTRLNGRIWVESEPGFGSIFRFTLPAVAEAA